MNSEPWRDPLQELWQRQPVPAPLRVEDRMLRDMRAAEEEWEHEWGGAERTFVVAALVMGGPELLRLAFAREFDWVPFAMTAVWWWWAAVALTFRWRRRRLERAYQQALRERIARGRRLLRERMRFNDASLLVVPVVSLLVGMTLWDLADGSMAAAVLGGGATLAVLAWSFVAHRRKQRAQFERRLAVLDEMHAQLTAADSADRR